MKPKHFISFIQKLLPDDQWLYFSHWLAVALRSLKDGDFRPGQLVALAGPPQCGKSLLQAIITEVLGGRVESPFAYMMGLTQFNAELAGAEHWQIEDPASSLDIRTRRLFGAMLKESTVNKMMKIHAKGKQAVTLPVFRRVTLSINDEIENLSVLPPLDDSIVDKVFLFKCEPSKFGPNPGNRKLTWELILSEIPLIREWLLTLGDIPEGLEDDRFVIAAWHHPDLLEALGEMEPQTRLWDLITQALWAKPDDKDIPFIGRAIDLERQLIGYHGHATVEKLLKHSNTCGTYLLRLAKRYPDLISKRVKDGTTRWTILPPSQNQK